MTDEVCDVLVVGSGGAAMAGAWTAARAGLDVLLVEATDRFGGTTAYSGGGMWLPCNAVLRRAGDDDTVEDALAYFTAVVGERTPRALQEAFVRGGAPLVDALEQDPDLAFEVRPWPDYYGAVPHARSTGRHIIPSPLPAEALGDLRASLRPPLPTDRGPYDLPPTVAGGQALIGRFLLSLSRCANARTRRSSTCVELLREDGRVVGAVLEQDGGRQVVRARRGVLVAAGGFERSAELRATYGVPGGVRDSMSPDGNLGRALEAAVAVGADTDLMDQAWWSPGLTHPDGTSTFSLWFTGGLLVGDDGRRFVDESWPYDRLARVALDRLADGTLTLPFWMVYDDVKGVRPPVRSTSVPMVADEAYVEAGLWRSAPTLELLAEQIGVPAAALVETVERFNGFCATEVDEDFGRGDEAYDRSFSGGRSPLVPVGQPPFHAAAFGLSDLGTKGGLRTDASARVLDAGGVVVPGLYAAGNSMAAVSGETYPAGGNPIGAGMVFAHLAVLDMVSPASASPARR